MRLAPLRAATDAIGSRTLAAPDRCDYLPPNSILRDPVLSISDVKARIEDAFPGATVEVTDPRGSSNYFEAVIISSAFDGMPRIKRHRAIMGLFDAELKSGVLHALTFKAYTPEQFANAT